VKVVPTPVIAKPEPVVVPTPVPVVEEPVVQEEVVVPVVEAEVPVEDPILENIESLSDQDMIGEDTPADVTP